MDGLDDPPEGRPMPPQHEFSDGEDHPVGHDTNLDKHNGDDLQGSKNLVVNLKSVKLKGIISAATQKYRDGLAVIDESNRLELSNITQTAAEPVNNGVIVSLNEGAVWQVTGTSWLTSLHIGADAQLIAPEGKTLEMYVDGVLTEVKAGDYRGVIELKA